jgi:hypothetical protein
MAKTTRPAGQPVPQSKTELTTISSPPNLLAGAQVPTAAKAFLTQIQGNRTKPAKVPIIKIDHRESKFVLPSGELVDFVEGYPVYLYHTRRYYAKPPKPGETGTPPDCWSGDCIAPNQDSLDVQSELCATCPNNAFGTARDGRSKACGTYSWVFILNPAYGSPPLAVLIAPPSSLRSLVGTRFDAGFFSQAEARHGCYEIVWSRFSLEQKGDQVLYSVVHGEMGDAAGEEQAMQIARIRNSFLEMMDMLRGDSAAQMEVEEPEVA